MPSADFFLRRVHSLTGIVPIGFFMLEHMFSISQAIVGPAAFDRTVSFLQSLPFVVPLEIGFIAVPLAFHAFYGLYVAYLAKNNQLSYRYFRNWMFYLQRATAVITLAFLVWHVWVLRIGKALYGTEITFSHMAGLLGDPLVFALYAVGLAAGLLHFVNGLWTFLITWGITIGPRSQTAAMYACSFVFVFLYAVGVRALFAFVS
ncbi:MAG: succinate dehydrogenase cytochrome b558 subunit [Sporomusaceae bacterium]|nr:succinate dehydrogenase cytochrome b558 subunit [Sporomusaceae bacterium]